MQTLNKFQDSNCDTSQSLRMICAALVCSCCLLLGPRDISAEGVSTPADSEQLLVSKINQRIRERWTAEKVVPAAVADDAEFLRRIYLDLAGQIPSVSEVRKFLESTATNKRQAIVHELLDGPRYIVHSSNVWRAELLPEASSDPQLTFLMPSFEAWLKDQLIDNDSYADLARKLVTYKIEPLQMGRSAFESAGSVSPVAFYQAKEGKPENLAAGTARVFLGLRIECAQCHDHPFDSWKQQQFWSFAAFYSGVSRQQMGDIAGPLTDDPNRRKVEIPILKTTVEARYLNNSIPDWKPTETSRENLANWLTARNNPYFAKAGVNRVWGRLFGVGIVNPVDDFSEANVPSHPELLNELAAAFAESNYDLKFLLRVLTSTEAYQLTSRVSDPSQETPQNFARMTPKGLTPNQLFDSLAQATGFLDPNRRDLAFVADESRPRSEFQEAFSNESDPPTERQTTILQALAMMNGRFLSDNVKPDKGLLSAVANFPDMTLEERIETLYLATLGRKPTPIELPRLIKYCDGRDLKVALGDIFWTLLNSTEFSLNH
ncbi:MAG: hypothetical protein JWM11_3377 [Planctomycetaceae bacterium]|nr:hypothetical protein [Planctomycetaceae bacterium]